MLCNLVTPFPKVSWRHHVSASCEDHAFFPQSVISNAVSGKRKKPAAIQGTVQSREGSIPAALPPSVTCCHYFNIYTGVTRRYGGRGCERRKCRLMAVPCVCFQTCKVSCRLLNYNRFECFNILCKF